jgi:hypothetical protein
VPELPALIDRDEDFIPEGAATVFSAAASPMPGNTPVPEQNYSVSPSGFSLLTEHGTRALAVLPFVRSLDLRCSVDGERVHTLSLWHGALTGLMLPAGRHTVRCEVPYTLFHLFLACYLVLNVAAFLLLLWFMGAPAIKQLFPTGGPIK